MPDVCARCGSPFLPTGQCSRYQEGCQGGWGERVTAANPWPHAADCAFAHPNYGPEYGCDCHVAEIERLRLALDCELGVRHMTVARLAGKVEGRPTHTGNFLQRVDELRRIEDRERGWSKDYDSLARKLDDAEKEQERLRGIIEDEAKEWNRRGFSAEAAALRDKVKEGR